MKLLKTNREKFELFVERIVGSGILYANVEDEQGRVHFEKLPLDQLNKAFLEKARAVETTKAFFFIPRTKVAEYPSSADAALSAQPVTILGLRACELKALQITDRVFLDDQVDPFYKARREGALIITCDCTAPWETCFCTEMGYLPYPQEGFDLNLSLAREDILVEVGSEKGQALIDQHAVLFSPADESFLQRRRTNREATTQQVKKNNQRFAISAPYEKTIQRQLTSQMWNQPGLAYSCVECGACTHVCPTCRCFQLWDQPTAQGAERIMVWDVCFYPGYWRMAGNLSPKPSLLRRFQNRFSCKFSYFVSNYDAIACTGCGRCIEACMGNIDIRECLSQLQAGEKVSS